MIAWRCLFLSAVVGGQRPPPQRAEGAAVQGAARRRAPARGYDRADVDADGRADAEAVDEADVRADGGADESPDVRADGLADGHADADGLVNYRVFAQEASKLIHDMFSESYDEPQFDWAQIPGPEVEEFLTGLLKEADKANKGSLQFRDLKAHSAHLRSRVLCLVQFARCVHALEVRKLVLGGAHLGCGEATLTHHARLVS